MPRFVTRTVLAIIFPFLSMTDALYFSFFLIVCVWIVFLKPKYIVLDAKIAVIIKKIKKIKEIRSKDIFKFDLFFSNLKFFPKLFIFKYISF